MMDGPLRGREPRLSAASRTRDEVFGMCGIYGAVGPTADVMEHWALGLIGHRGPDAAGISHRTVNGLGPVTLAMTRLAIVDKNPIGVPFDFTRSTGVLLAFNGEIYNWRALRTQLSDGHAWETECDAEVIARAWRCYGPAMLDYFNGMWAMALLDTWSGRLFLARDRAGEKPLYLLRRDGTLHFASEVKAFPGPLVEGPCPELDALEVDCDVRTPFRDVENFPPGACMLLDDGPAACTSEPVRWWSLPEPRPEPAAPWLLMDELEELVIDAVRIRIPDEGVPWATLLSGGVDSAIVQAVAPSKRLYCVTFPDLDNLTPARMAAGRGFEPVAVTFGIADLLDVLAKVAWHLDTPGTWTAVCQWFLAERMAQDGIRVALSGEGADELFHGYSRYRALHHLETMRLDRVLRTYGPLVEHLVGSPTEILARLLCRDQDHLDTARALVERYGIPQHGLVESAARIDWHTTMQVLLRMADRMMASRSIESRAPFLDHRLISLASRLPSNMKAGQDLTKSALRHVAVKLGVPEAIAYEPSKRGLAVPWATWRKSDDGERGRWDRASFARLMRSAWHKAFALGVAPSVAAA